MFFRFLYQVFPGHTVQWHRLFFKSVRNGDFDVVKKMVMFFEESHPGFIHEKEMPSGNTALHVAAKYGHFVSSFAHSFRPSTP